MANEANNSEVKYSTVTIFNATNNYSRYEVIDDNTLMNINTGEIYSVTAYDKTFANTYLTLKAEDGSELTLTGTYKKGIDAVEYNGIKLYAGKTVKLDNGRTASIQSVNPKKGTITTDGSVKHNSEEFFQSLPPTNTSGQSSTSSEATGETASTTSTEILDKVTETSSSDTGATSEAGAIQVTEDPSLINLAETGEVLDSEQTPGVNPELELEKQSQLQDGESPASSTISSSDSNSQIKLEKDKFLYFDKNSVAGQEKNYEIKDGIIFFQGEEWKIEKGRFVPVMGQTYTLKSVNGEKTETIYGKLNDGVKIGDKIYPPGSEIEVGGEKITLSEINADKGELGIIKDSQWFKWIPKTISFEDFQKQYLSNLNVENTQQKKEEKPVYGPVKPDSPNIGINKEELQKCLEKKVYLTPTFKKVYDVLEGNNKQKADKLKNSLAEKIKQNESIINEPRITNGNYADALKSFNEALDEALKTVDENAKTAVVAATLCDELKEHLKRLAEIDNQREEKRKTLETANNEFEELKNNPEPESFECNCGTTTTSKGTKITNCEYGGNPHPNPKYSTWKKNRDDKENEVKSLMEEIKKLDKEGEMLSSRCHEILGEEVDLEQLIKDLGIDNRPPYNRGDDDYDGGNNNNESTNNIEKPIIELPDNSYEHMKYYNELTPDELSLISQNLQAFADTNNITIEQLLMDEQYSELLAQFLQEIEFIPDELVILIKQGNPKGTQSALRKVFTGQEQSAIGMNNDTKKVLYNYLNNVADSNNTTLSSLINDENNENILRNSLSEYGKVHKTFDKMGNNQLNDKVISIYDGDGIENIDDTTISVVRDFVDIKQANNTSNTNYLEQGNMAQDMNNLSKSSIYMNIISKYSDEGFKNAFVSSLK